MGRGLQYSSGRVIGLGRLLLAILYSIAILVDSSQPARAPVGAYAMLACYLAFAAITVAVTWNDWWLDAKLAGPAHAGDILFFTLLVLLTEGYTSPYFTFFMFVLLSAAIRWGWRATALTSVLLVLLYLIAGLLVARSSPEVDLQSFAVRTGHLLILSLILIWFGASRWGMRDRSRSRDLLGHPSLDRSPIDSGVGAVMAGLRAPAGAFVWKAAGGDGFAGIAVRDGERTVVALPPRSLERTAAASPFLYDLGEDRCLRRVAERNLAEGRAADLIDPQAASRLALRRGLAIPVRLGDGEGVMFLEGIAGLSIDHIDLGEQLAAELAAHIQAHALLAAADESAESRSRLTLARDLHDGVVQFLAGAAFRLEAMRRSQANGRDLAPDLDELKQLLLQEQHELRTFITALRAGPVIGFDDLARDLQSLAGRLSRQWDVRCTLSAEPSDKTIPARLHLDAQQLMREAVANAVRHAHAKSVKIELAAEDEELRMRIFNDGAAPSSPGGRLQTPRSLKERVEQAGGALDFSRGMDVTRLSIALPIVTRPR